MSKRRYTLCETFVGAGGSHLGFAQEGFKTIYANDIADDCLKTLTYNNPQLLQDKATIDHRSILEIDIKNLRKILKIKQNEIDVFFGGVVCKGFSLAGERSPNDARNYLYKKQLEFIEEFLPKISIIENVTGILNTKILNPEINSSIREEIDILWKKLEDYKGKKSALRKNGKITAEFENQGFELRKQKLKLLKNLEDKNLLIFAIDDIKKTYNRLGYNIYISILNSAWYGSATKRERVFIVAVRSDLKTVFEFPDPIFMDQNLFKQGMDVKLLKLPPPISVNDALNLIDYSKYDEDNIPMQHNPKTIERFKYIPEGESIANHIDKLPQDLKVSKFYSRGSTMRLNGNLPSPTLVPGHSNFPIHPKEHRSITVREAATITGFPLDYKFFGSHSRRCEQVGNAVPPPLSRFIAKQCVKILESYYKNK